MVRSRGERIFEVFNYLILTLLAIVTLAPFLHVAAKSLSHEAAVMAGEVGLCVETRGRDLVDESPDTLEGLLDALVDRYLRIDCACFTPNVEGLDHIVEMARDLKADEVVHYGLSFCQPYAIEAFKVGKALDAAQIPMLAIETDYSMEDVEQLKTRVEAFLEMLH
uniref:2-hydroxyacyl-CoA dehydratase n=1 Tax=Desulfobacca acetoxidans TaxID=60893 RepID=A0A7V4GA06_9BACT